MEDALKSVGTYKIFPLDSTVIGVEREVSNESQSS